MLAADLGVSRGAIKSWVNQAPSQKHVIGRHVSEDQMAQFYEHQGTYYERPLLGEDALRRPQRSAS